MQCLTEWATSRPEGWGGRPERDQGVMPPPPPDDRTVMRVRHTARLLKLEFQRRPCSRAFLLSEEVQTMTPRMPKGFRAAGQKLWRSVIAEYELAYEPHKVEILTHACRVSDAIAELERAAAKEPLTVQGSAGQKVIQPLISEIRFQRGLLAQLLARLNFEGQRTTNLTDAEDTTTKPTPQRQRPRSPGCSSAERTENFRCLALPRRVTGLPEGSSRFRARPPDTPGDVRSGVIRCGLVPPHAEERNMNADLKIPQLRLPLR